MHKTLTQLIAVVSLAVLLAACESEGGAPAPAADSAEEENPGGTEHVDERDDEDGSAGEHEAEEADRVTYLTSFSTFGRDAYVYVADELGFFEEAGLEVDINPGDGTVEVMRLIAAGSADFGPGDAATAAITIANQELPVRAVATVQQESLAALVALESSGITEPADLEGVTYADSAASTVNILLPFYAEAAGFDADTVEFVPASPPDLPRLLAAGQADVIGQFVVGRGLIQATADESPEFFPYTEHLPDLYGNVVIARQDMMEEQPDLVRRFVNALLRGLEYSIENPQESGEILARHVAEQPPEPAAAEVEIMAPYVRPEGFTGRIGDMDRDRMASMIELLSDAGALEASLDVDGFMTDEFLPGR